MPNNDDDEAFVIEQLALLVRKLSSEQQLALRYLMRFFHNIASHAAKNRMAIDNLVTCVGPSLSFAPGWLKWSILHFDKIFATP